MSIYSYSTVTATLAASTAYTALEIQTAASTDIRVLKWWVELNSVTSTDKFVLVQMGVFSAAATTATTVTPAKVDYGGASIASQSTVRANATVEGAGTFTAGGEQHYVGASSGYTFWEPDRAAWQFAASAFIRIRLTPGSAITSATAAVGWTWEE